MQDHHGESDVPPVAGETGSIPSSPTPVSLTLLDFMKQRWQGSYLGSKVSGRFVRFSLVGGLGVFVNLLAMAELFSDDPLIVERSLTRSEEAMRLGGGQAAIQATRGSALAWFGFADEAFALLAESITKTPARAAKAEVAAFLGLAEHHRGHLRESAKWLRKAGRWDPSNVGLRRVRARLVQMQDALPVTSIA